MPTAPSPRRPLPPPLTPIPPGFGRATPPAVFGPILGLLGLGHLLRALGAALGQGWLVALADLALGALVLLHAFALAALLAKIARRPGALAQDMRILPGRAGLAAGLAAVHLSAAALVPFAPGLALAVTLAGLAAQAAFMAGVAVLLARGPAEGRAVNPVFHLTFVGIILAPFALIPLGWTGASAAILVVALVMAGAIWALALPRARATPAPLRPVLAIHLAPASVGSSVAALLGWPGLAMALGLWALALALALVLAGLGGWLLNGGFSPFWGALTFPAAAFGQAALRGLGAPGLWIALAVAALACVAVPWIAWRILKLWPQGRLARLTNAAIA